MGQQRPKRQSKGNPQRASSGGRDGRQRSQGAGGGRGRSGGGHKGRSGSAERTGKTKSSAASRSAGSKGAARAGKARRDLKGAAVDLPRWVVDDLTRVTPRERVGDALAELGAASAAMVEGRYKVALRSARRAKALAPRDATVRETLGLAAYRVGDWQTALTELRTYRRLSGEATHLPVEMDVLRALERPGDLHKLWEELQRSNAGPAILKEGLVVYASHLIDEGQVEEARRLASPKRLKPDPYPADLRVWYVAARANALAGDLPAARQLRDAIVLADPAFPGLDDLDVLISRAAP